jgi:hypothetical protein
MKRPPFRDYVTGNPITVLCLLGFAGLFGYHSWLGDAPPWIVVVLLFMLAASSAASARISKFKAWEREWNATSGVAPRASLFARMPALRNILGGGVWVILGIGAVSAGADPTMALPVACYWLATTAMIGWGLFRLVRRKRPPASQLRDVAVSVCIAKPARSPEVREAYAALPAYCLSPSNPGPRASAPQ